MKSFETKKEKTNLIKEIKELESEFKKPGIKSKKTLIEKSILEKEAKVREIENQLRPTKKEKENKKEKLPESSEVDRNKSEAIDNKKEEKKAEEKEVDWDNSPMIKSEGGRDVPVQGSEAKQEVNWDESAVIDAEAGGKKTKEEVNWDESDIITAEKGGESKKEKKEELPEQTMEKEGERKQIEYKGESLEEKKQKIEKLWLDVEKNRKEYLEKDYKNNTGLARVKNFFGSFLKKDKDGAGFQSEKELAEYRAYYDNSLLEHKKAVLDEARLRGAYGKELLDIAKFYQVEANINLADVHDQVKIENEGSIFVFINKHNKELVEKYKKMPLAKKIAIGAAFGLAGVGAIYIGGAAVGIAGSAIAARRAIMGVITGTTVSLGFEARGKKKTTEKIQKEMEKLEKKITGLSEEEKVKILEGFIDKDIQDEEQKINKIKNKNLRHLAYGVTAGIGIMLAPKITRMFSEASGPGGSIPEHPGGQNVPIGESEGPERLGMTDEEISAAESEEPERLGLADEEIEKTPETEETTPEVAQVAAKEELETPGMEQVIVEVQKGDSLWKIIDKQLENHDGYVELNEAQKTYVINALKDRVAEDPEKFGLDNIDKLKIGRKIDLSEIFQDKQPENLIAKVQDLNEDQMNNILENNEKLRDWVEANPGEELTSEKTEEILKEIKETKDIPAASNFEEVSETEEIKEAPETPEKSEVEEIPKTEETSSVEESPEVEEVEGAPKTEEVGEIPKASEEPVIEDNTDASEQAEKSAEAEEPEIQFEKASREPEVALSAEAAHKIIERSADKFGENITRVGWVDTTNFPDGQRGVSWNEIKDIRYSAVQSEGSSVVPKYIKDRMDKIISFSKEKFGSEGILRPNDTLKDWLVRLIEKHGEDKIKNIFEQVK